MTFLDVGQGDAVVIRSPEGRTAMIDAGSASPLRFLQQMSVDSIDLLVATHPHEDHIGGVQDVLTARPVRLFVDNGRERSSAAYERLMATLELLEGVTYQEAYPRTIALGSVTLEVLPPPADDRGVDASVGLVLRYGRFSALLTGDSERTELDHWVSRERIPRTTLLKAPHHGSVRGFTRALLDAARPQVVVVSVGAGNHHGHPRPEAMAAYDTYADHVLRTDRDGHVTVLGYEDGRVELVTGADASLSGNFPLPSEPTDSMSPAPPGLGGLSLTVVASAPPGGPEQLNGEYATLVNRSAANVAIGGWRLCDLRTRCFRFPPGARVLGGGQVRVYTGYGMTDGFSFFMNNDRAVWNDDGDEATLFDERGEVVTRLVY